MHYLNFLLRKLCLIIAQANGIYINVVFINFLFAESFGFFFFSKHPFSPVYFHPLVYANAHSLQALQDSTLLLLLHHYFKYYYCFSCCRHKTGKYSFALLPHRNNYYGENHNDVKSFTFVV